MGDSGSEPRNKEADRPAHSEFGRSLSCEGVKAMEGITRDVPEIAQGSHEPSSNHILLPVVTWHHRMRDRGDCLQTMVQIHTRYDAIKPTRYSQLGGLGSTLILQRNLPACQRSLGGLCGCDPPNSRASCLNKFCHIVHNCGIVQEVSRRDNVLGTASTL
jgi:hypothetical protein